MKLAQWLERKRWNMSIFSREVGVTVPILSKIINETGSINLDTALKIEQATDGKVTVWDLSPNVELIRKGKPFGKAADRKKKADKEKKNKHKQ